MGRSEAECVSVRMVWVYGVCESRWCVVWLLTGHAGCALLCSSVVPSWLSELVEEEELIALLRRPISGKLEWRCGGRFCARMLDCPAGRTGSLGASGW